MKNELLPIGSIITVKGYDLMICAYLGESFDYDGDEFDYACCLYPTGVSKEAQLVKKDDIEKVKFIGFQDARFIALKQRMANKNGQ